MSLQRAIGTLCLALSSQQVPWYCVWMVAVALVLAHVLLENSDGDNTSRVMESHDTAKILS